MLKQALHLIVSDLLFNGRFYDGSQIQTYKIKKFSNTTRTLDTCFTGANSLKILEKLPRIKGESI